MYVKEANRLPLSGRSAPTFFDFFYQNKSTKTFKTNLDYNFIADSVLVGAICLGSEPTWPKWFSILPSLSHFLLLTCLSVFVCIDRPMPIALDVSQVYPHCHPTKLRQIIWVVFFTHFDTPTLYRVSYKARHFDHSEVIKNEAQARFN